MKCPRRMITAIALLAAMSRPAQGVTRVFRDGLAGYAGTRDTFLQQAAPSLNNGGLSRIEWDGDDPPASGSWNVALLRFDAIIGNGPTQIPPGSAINSATLTYHTYDAGDVGLMFEALVNWTESTTWNGFGGNGTPGVQPSEYGAFVASLSGEIGAFNVDVTSSLVTWAASPGANHGWVVLPNGNGGVELRSSEYNADPSLRPTLTVTYDEPAIPALVRSPYLQLSAPTMITICWRTNVPTNSRLRYGPMPTMLDQSVVNAELKQNHALTINGLAPGSTFYYDVGTTTQVLAGGDAEHFFKTPPTVGSQAAFTVWLFGDSGNGTVEQVAVRDAMLAETVSHPPDLFLHLGDIAYSNGSDDEFTSYFFSTYADILRNTVCWPTMGNHEGVSSDSGTQSGPYYQSFVLPTAGEAGGLPSGTEAYYSFDRGDVHFVCLDSHDTPRTPGSPMLTWLAADLQATDRKWLIAFWHHPPYSKGSHDSDDPLDSDGRMRDMREYILPLLEAAGVDLVLAGHSHIYERSFLVDGAYDTPTTAEGHIIDGGDGRMEGNGAYRKLAGLTGHGGAVYVVAGHGGATLGGTGGHVLMYFTELQHGSCLMTIDGNTLHLRNLRMDGVVSDWFTLIKSLAGDIDADSDVDEIDLSLFVAVLTDQDSDPAHVSRSDLDDNGVPNGLDIELFVESLLTP